MGDTTNAVEQVIKILDSIKPKKKPKAKKSQQKECK
jgi:hypothetical protein